MDVNRQQPLFVVLFVYMFNELCLSSLAHTVLSVCDGAVYNLSSCRTNGNKPLCTTLGLHQQWYQVVGCVERPEVVDFNGRTCRVERCLRYIHDNVTRIPAIDYHSVQSTSASFDRLREQANRFWRADIALDYGRLAI